MSDLWYYILSIANILLVMVLYQVRFWYMRRAERRRYFEKLKLEIKKMVKNGDVVSIDSDLVIKDRKINLKGSLYFIGDNTYVIGSTFAGVRRIEDAS